MSIRGLGIFRQLMRSSSPVDSVIRSVKLEAGAPDSTCNCAVPASSGVDCIGVGARAGCWSGADTWVATATQAIAAKSAIATPPVAHARPEENLTSGQSTRLSLYFVAQRTPFFKCVQIVVVNNKPARVTVFSTLPCRSLVRRASKEVPKVRSGRAPFV